MPYTAGTAQQQPLRSIDGNVFGAQQSAPPAQRASALGSGRLVNGKLGKFNPNLLNKRRSPRFDSADAINKRQRHWMGISNGRSAWPTQPAIAIHKYELVELCPNNRWRVPITNVARSIVSLNLYILTIINQEDTSKHGAKENSSSYFYVAKQRK